jgi:ABC-type spermidine/putrescine transport system permease subunit I
VCVILYLLPLVAWLSNLPPDQSQLRVSRIYLAQIGVTVGMSFLSAVGAAIMGGSVACLSAFSPPRTAKKLAFFMMLPLLVGFVARNYSWTGLLSHFHAGPFGFLGRLQDSGPGVVLVMSVVFTPFAYFVVSQRALRLSPEYYAVARTLGATDARSFVAITLPLLLPGVGLAIGTAFILGIGYYIAPQLIGGGNFPFIGNGVLSLLNGLGKAPSASRLALGLLGTVMVPTLAAAGCVALVWYRRRLRRAREKKEIEGA